MAQKVLQLALVHMIAALDADVVRHIVDGLLTTSVTLAHIDTAAVVIAAEKQGTVAVVAHTDVVVVVDNQGTVAAAPAVVVVALVHNRIYLVANTTQS